MVSEWRPLGEFVSLASGNTPSKANPKFWGGTVPWVSAKDMSDFWLDDSEDHLTTLGVENASRIVPAGTVLMLVRGMTLHNRVPICRVTKDVAFNQDVKAVLPKEGLHARFLPYLLAGNHARLHGRVDSAGHGTGRLNTDEILSLPVFIPSKAEQVEIAAIGEGLDERIYNLRQTNTTLEAIANTLFKSWLVNFDGVPPEDMQQSELGLIPKGWRAASLDSIAHYLNGLALQKFPPDSETEFLPVIKIAQLRAGNTKSADRASTRLKREYIVEDGDVLFSWSGSLEVEVWTGGRGALNQHLFKVTSDEVPKWFYYFATRQHLPDFRIIAAGKATTMGHIQRKHLTDARIAVPPPDVMDKFDSTIAPLFEQIINNALQSKTFAQLRDTMLPKLISSELRIRDAERFLGEAT